MNIELLAPAGNLEKLKIAIKYGADAVYIAGQQFGLRSAADNFSESEIREAVEYASRSGKKVYVTLNAYLHDEDLDGLPEFIDFLEDVGIHGAICSDLAVVNLVRNRSRIPVHISTQASVLNSAHASIWKDNGASRIVVGRELTIQEAAKLKKQSGLEVEMFVHGALCMSYSGHCSLSTYIAGRDSNRGGCIQNCRFNYMFHDERADEKSAYFMSSKDLCGISLLEEFIEAGIDSLKIEGRMKSELYIASTVRAYAGALRELKLRGKCDKEKWMSELEKIPHRDYTTAWLNSPATMDSVYNQHRIAFNDYKLAGIVLEVVESKSRFAFQVKNKLTRGDIIEILKFDGALEKIEMPTLENIVGSEIDVAQPGTIVWLPLQKGIAARNVARIYRPDQ